MRTLAAVVLGVALASCATGQPKPSEGASSTSSPDPQPAAPAAGADAGEASQEASRPVPPPAASTARVTLEGCLAQAGSEADGDKYPPRPATRSVAPAPVSVSITGLGITVAHDLEHACCLGAQVSASVEQGTIRVVERLEGSPCRCRCSSTIKTAVGLVPGEYTLVVSLDTGSGPQEVHRQAVAVRTLGGR